MSITDSFTVGTNSTGTLMFWPYNGETNSFHYEDDEDEKALQAKREKSRKALAQFRECLFNWTLKPLLLVFRRYDFRGAPRWSAERWKAKT